MSFLWAQRSGPNEVERTERTMIHKAVVNTREAIELYPETLSAKRFLKNPCAILHHEQELRLTINPGVMGGKACIRGKRVTVGMIVESLASGRSVSDLLNDFPYLKEGDIREALSFAASLAQGRDIPLSS